MNRDDFMRVYLRPKITTEKGMGSSIKTYRHSGVYMLVLTER